jgi:membrane fusion protein (multidrug efflux system)
MRSAVFLAVAFLIAGLSGGCKKKPPPPPPPPEVHVTTVTPTNVPVYREWIGSIEGFVNAQIRAQVTGYLQSQTYSEGKQLKKGDLLFEIDPRPFQAALEQARGKLAQDEAEQQRTAWDVKRYEPLAKEDAISQQEFNNAVQANLAAQAQIKADQAAVKAAEVNLSFTRIASPIDGVAGTAEAQIGDLVGPNGAVLTTVSTVDPIKVYFNASEQAYLTYRRQYSNEVERTSHEQDLEFSLILADGSTYVHPGKFLFAGREVNPTTGTIQLAAQFPNPANVLRPGQFARVRARVQTRPEALLVPQRAVNELQGSYQVAVVDDQNKVHLQTVKVGERIGSSWVIEEGLKPGNRVIVEGLQKVKEGATVSPKPFIDERSRTNAEPKSLASG